MASIGRLSSVVGMLGFESGQGGFEKIWVLGRMFGSGLTSFRPSPFLVVKDPQTQSPRILEEPHLIDAEFRNAWAPFFFWSGHPVATPDQFLDFLGHLLPQEPQFDLPRITERDLQKVARAKKSTAGRLDGWAWNEIKALRLPWFSGLATLLELVETSGVWPQGLLDACIAMISEADGDSTPLGQTAPSVFYRLCKKAVGPRSGLVFFGIGSRSGYLSLSLVWVMVSLLLKLGLPLL